MPNIVQTLHRWLWNQIYWWWALVTSFYSPLNWNLWHCWRLDWWPILWYQPWWNYDQPVYVIKNLTRYNHPSLLKLQHCPYKPIPIVYSKDNQAPTPTDDIPVINAAEKQAHPTDCWRFSLLCSSSWSHHSRGVICNPIPMFDVFTNCFSFEFLLPKIDFTDSLDFDLTLTRKEFASPNWLWLSLK